MKIVPNGKQLGAVVEDLDISVSLASDQIEEIVRAVGRHGVLEFPEQTLTSLSLRNFSRQFGELLISPGGRAQDPAVPEVMILSNMVEDGKPLGLSDAGQSWHTDMSYAPMVAFANVLYGMTIPHRAGRPLGDTQFQDMHAAYETLPADLKTLLDGRTATHDFNKFWEMMRSRPGSKRSALSDTERRLRAPVSKPVLMPHPITGKKVLYANPGYTMKIDGMGEAESAEILDFLFEHQLRGDFRYDYQWRVGSVLMWDNLGTLHNAVPDYGPDEHRYIKRCQVMATRFFNDDGTMMPSPIAVQETEA
jgi:taurine dioxygenase